jgi:phospholipid/cholesterol/gamma-HCH transport system substrate-binding protein
MADITIRISGRALKFLLALLAVVVLLCGFSSLISWDVFHPKYQIQMFVPNSSGLQPGAPVILDGLSVGRVSSVRIVQDSIGPNRSVEVTLRIEKRFQNMIRDDAVAFLAVQGLLGQQYVNIQRGFSGSPIKPGGEIRAVPQREMTFTDLMGAVKKIENCQSADQKTPSSSKK